MFCCSLGTRIFVARGRFNAARDWVGSCGITIERRHKWVDVPEMNFLTLRVGNVLQRHALPLAPERKRNGIITIGL
jgi:hypothetical protein